MNSIDKVRNPCKRDQPKIPGNQGHGWVLLHVFFSQIFLSLLVLRNYPVDLKFSRMGLVSVTIDTDAVETRWRVCPKLVAQFVTAYWPKRDQPNRTN